VEGPANSRWTLASERPHDPFRRAKRFVGTKHDGLAVFLSTPVIGPSHPHPLTYRWSQHLLFSDPGAEGMAVSLAKPGGHHPAFRCWLKRLIAQAIFDILSGKVCGPKEESRLAAGRRT